MISLRAKESLPNMGGWKDRHNHAVSFEGYGSVNHLSSHVAFESAMIRMLTEWARYADDHKDRYESLIGADGVLGDYWRDIGLGLRGLLNGDCGKRLDMGTLDGFILQTLQDNGV